MLARCAPPQAVLENLGANGTLVNGATVDKDASVVLQHGDRIAIAERSFRFEYKQVRAARRRRPRCTALRTVPNDVDAGAAARPRRDRLRGPRRAPTATATTPPSARRRPSGCAHQTGPARRRAGC